MSKPTDGKRNRAVLCPVCGNYLQKEGCIICRDTSQPTGERKCSTCYYKRCPGNEGNGCSGWEAKPQPEDGLMNVIGEWYITHLGNSGPTENNARILATAIRTYLAREVGKVKKYNATKFIDGDVNKREEVKEQFIKLSDVLKLIGGGR